MAMPYGDINGQRLFFTDTGSGEDVIVFSHGFFMSHAMFEPQVAALSDRWRCITWDERGHGQTQTTPEPFSLWDSAHDLLGLMDHLDVERAVLAGMSQGGYLTFRAALSAPARVRALVLIATQPGVGGGLGASFDLDQLIEAWVAPGGPSPELVDAVAAIILGRDYEDRDVWMDAAAHLPGETVRQIFHTLRTRADDVTPRLDELTMPTLVVHGSDDLAIDLEVARSYVAALPHGELAVIEGGGHAANLTHVDAVNSVLETFLAKA